MYFTSGTAVLMTSAACFFSEYKFTGTNLVHRYRPNSVTGNSTRSSKVCWVACVAENFADSAEMVLQLCHS